MLSTLKMADLETELREWVRRVLNRVSGRFWGENRGMRKAGRVEEVAAMGLFARLEREKSRGIRCAEDGEEEREPGRFPEANDR
jgi:hypothetical protein